MDSYFANLRKASGAMELVLRNDDASSKSRRPRLRGKSNMKKPTSCPNYDAPNCPARKESHEDLDGYGSVHTFRAVNSDKNSSSASSSSSRRNRSFYAEVAPGLTSRSRRTAARRKDANEGWDSLAGSPTAIVQESSKKLSLRTARSQQDRSMLFQGMVSEVLQCHNDILGPRADDERSEQVKQQLSEYLKAVEGLVVHQQQEQQEQEVVDDEDPSQSEVPEQEPEQQQVPVLRAAPIPLATTNGYRSQLTRSASVKKD
eukprot:CAMPEP_0117075450 /NCGR_PEP_ID=MMETSP0472-20121206/53192_1 /TAXON_ID=693140 ORGANISM="Tiarina fusus, Strain LIS" /NCGR_SAMPLE_ID=MMETSP0472 /ASSEMBLY_ACC=CAM_ASM_000603 /LENGTH=258 /DNA_ID=CAMNT_0004800955 /DNA_START=33 /DNA_END=806 /DNA_ORIENTATION=-